jgi:hypothetical protein
MNNTICLFIFLVVFFTNCKNSSDENYKKSDLIPEANDDPDKTGADSIDKHQYLTEENRDTILKDTAKNNKVLSVNDWNIDDFIINNRDRSSKALRLSIEYEREQWKNVKNPFVASYRGCDLGDYFHLNFEDANGKNYDFGFGNNNYGKYLLYDKTDYNDNPKYLGKSFNIYWNWKITSFPCCDGEYDMVKAYLPSITKLELIETTANKK